MLCIFVLITSRLTNSAEFHICLSWRDPGWFSKHRWMFIPRPWRSTPSAVHSVAALQDLQQQPFAHLSRQRCTAPAAQVSDGFCMLHGHDCCWMDLDGIANEYDGSFCNHFDSFCVVFLKARKGLKMSQASQDLKCCKPQNTILDFWYREIIRIRNVRVCINR